MPSCAPVSASGPRSGARPSSSPALRSESRPRSDTDRTTQFTTDKGQHGKQPSTLRMEPPVHRPFGCDTTGRPLDRHSVPKPDLSPGADLITPAERHRAGSPVSNYRRHTDQTRANAAADFGYSYE